MIIAKRIWVNLCTLVVVGAAMVLAEYANMFFIPLLLIFFQSFALLFIRCRRCGHFLIFRYYVIVIPWIPNTCPKCGKINPLSSEKYEKK